MPSRRRVPRWNAPRFYAPQPYQGWVASRPPNVQLHLTGRDLIEMRRQQAEAVAQARAQKASAQARHMSNLSSAARWLHTPLGAILTLALYILGMIVAFGFNGSAAVLLVIGLSIALTVIDWRNFSSFHGVIPWNVWKVEGKNGRWWTLGIVLWLYGWLFMPAVYAIQAWRRAASVSATSRAQLNSTIASLEAEVFSPLPSDAIPYIPPPPPPPVVPLVLKDTPASNQPH